MTSRLGTARLRDIVELLVGATILGLGIGLMLNARLGSDGYSTFINGIALTAGVPFVVSNVGVGLVLIAFTAWRGVRLGLGTFLQPLAVGITVSATRGSLPAPDGLLGRAVECGVGFFVVAFGVALYLEASLGPGPAEGPALAVDPPVPFRFGYSALQIVQAAIGWLLGSPAGLGTLATVVFIGPVVDRIRLLLRRRGGAAARLRAESPLTEDS